MIYSLLGSVSSFEKYWSGGGGGGGDAPPPSFILQKCVSVVATGGLQESVGFFNIFTRIFAHFHYFNTEQINICLLG